MRIALTRYWGYDRQSFLSADTEAGQDLECFDAGGWVARVWPTTRRGGAALPAIGTDPGDLHEL